MLRLRFQLAAEILDMGIDCPFVGLERHAMDGFEQLSSREDPARLASESMEQIEFGGG